FLGIDHTAIGIANTESSLRFYRDVLGLRKAGESENFGTEQEHLNQVFGAHVHITGMRAASGPGIEFLEYLTPRDGRRRPVDSKANDLLHWQTTVVASDVDALARKLREAHAGFVSSSVVVMTKEKAGVGLWGPGTAYGIRDEVILKCHIAFSIPLDQLFGMIKKLNESGIDTFGFGGEKAEEPTVIGWMPSAQIYFRDPDRHMLEF